MEHTREKKMKQKATSKRKNIYKKALNKLSVNIFHLTISLEPKRRKLSSTNFGEDSLVIRKNLLEQLLL